MKQLNNFILPILVMCGLNLTMDGPLGAQMFTSLYSFTGGSDGAAPSGLVLSANTLYGYCSGGGLGNGTVFAISADGTGFRTLYRFTTGSNNSAGVYTNGDGKGPNGLALVDNTLYGTTSSGGRFGSGTIFALNTDGTGFRTLYSFTAISGAIPGPFSTNTDGAGPNGLSLSGATLYGTTSWGGSFGSGSVFSMNTDGTGFTSLYAFTAASDGLYNYTNHDGAWPYAGVIISGRALYGTASAGGVSGWGTVFKLNTDGSGFTVLHGFTPPTATAPSDSDGGRPESLILSGATLYGRAGANFQGGIFYRLNTDGTDYEILNDFASLLGSWAGLGADQMVLSNGVLYGTTQFDGNSGVGTVFAVNTDGSGFTTLYDFAAIPSYPGPYINSGGARPNFGVISSGNSLYGTTLYGGNSGNGTIFSLSLPISMPQLTINPIGGNVVLTWPTNLAGSFTLQSSSDLSSSANWMDSTAAPVIVADQFIITNTISSIPQFYRLKK